MNAARLPRPPVTIDEVFPDPAIVDELVRQHQPYWPVQKYVSNNAEYATLSGSGASSTPMIVAPVFRGDWALNDEVRPGIEPLLQHEPFVEGARQLFDASIVRPHTVYVNLTWQLPFQQGRGHVDIPAFRGFDRTTVPIAFLTIIGQSGLFEEERVKVATAVAWFYLGADGGFEYWPEGPQGASLVHEGGIQNTAVVGDNDFMWHRVRPTGRPEDGMVTLSLDSTLATDDGASWRIDDPVQGRVAEFPWEKVRVSLSWKATAFSDEEDRRRHDDHLDDLDTAEVLRRLSADLDARGMDPTVPTEDPFRDEEFLDRLQAAYMRYPA
jgi:hypothetical protein